jgi:hypothetical protein
MAELDGTDRLVNEKMTAMLQVSALIAAYKKETCDNIKIIKPIAEKKLAFIKTATTKAELKEILEPTHIYYDGNEIQAKGKFSVPEEELIQWSMASLRAPLNSTATRRMTELMEQVFPGWEKEVA